MMQELLLETTEIMQNRFVKLSLKQRHPFKEWDNQLAHQVFFSLALKPALKSLKLAFKILFL